MDYNPLAESLFLGILRMIINDTECIKELSALISKDNKLIGHSITIHFIIDKERIRSIKVCEIFETKEVYYEIKQNKPLILGQIIDLKTAKSIYSSLTDEEKLLLQLNHENDLLDLKLI